MIDRKTMRSLLQNMEQAAEQSLLENTNFHAALQALKIEIDNDPLVQITVGELQAAGRSVFNSFTPHIKIRVRTEEGIFALPKAAEVPMAPPVEKITQLTQELRTAASQVIRNSRHYFELDNIVNHVVGSNPRFEGIASQIESAGHEVLICLDLSAYARVRSVALLPGHKLKADQVAPMYLSGADLNFLKGVGIRVEGSQES